MKKTQFAEVLEARGYHVNEYETSMVVWHHGDFVCSIARCSLTGHYSTKGGSRKPIPNRIKALIETYGDM